MDRLIAHGNLDNPMVKTLASEWETLCWVSVFIFKNHHGTRAVTRILHKPCAYEYVSALPILEFYVPTTGRIISGWVPHCDSSQSWQHYNIAPLEHQIMGSMSQFPIQLHYLYTLQTSPYPVLVMRSARLSRNNYQFCKYLVWLDRELNPRPSTQT